MREFTTPGQMIAALLEERNWTQETLAVVLEKSVSWVNKVIAGKLAVTTDTALALEDTFAVDADIFLKLQREYDLAVARLSVRPDKGRATRAALFGDLPVNEMVKRGWISPENPQDLRSIEQSLVKFFGANSPDEIEVLPHAAKKMMVNTDPTPAQLAWLYRVKSIAEEQLVAKYTTNALKAALPKLHKLMVAPEEARKVPRILAECGVRFVIVQSLASAKIDGVCFWLDDQSPVVGLSIRHDRIDNFGSFCGMSLNMSCKVMDALK